MPAEINIGIAGLGQIGCGLVNLLAANHELIHRRCGRRPVIRAVSARDRHRKRSCSWQTARWEDDPLRLAADPGIDIVVELIGGADGVALALARACLGRGKPLVTANKALLALHGPELSALAARHDCPIGLEAAVAGGIPVIRALGDGLAGNRIRQICGILNGTCNFVLSRMDSGETSLDQALDEARRLGYAEADPSMDIDGTDTAHKLALLSALAFGTLPPPDAIHTRGIRELTAGDISCAAGLGYRIRLLGIARGQDGGIRQSVHPAMVPLSSPLAHVGGITNAVIIEGDQIGSLLMSGPGAGAAPTASAVAGDLVEIARGRGKIPDFRVSRERPRTTPEAWRAPFCLHLPPWPGDDRLPAAVTSILEACGIPVASVLRKDAPPDRAALVIMTRETDRETMARATGTILGLENGPDRLACLPVESPPAECLLVAPLPHRHQGPGKEVPEGWQLHSA